MEKNHNALIQTIYWLILLLTAKQLLNNAKSFYCNTLVFILFLILYANIED